MQNWDYLILTAANDQQAMLYREQLAVREQLGTLCNFKNWLVVADPEGRRVGSGGSTLYCLLEVLNRDTAVKSAEQCESVLGNLRILIVHAGGDSRRLPAYGPCGKVFVPLPSEDNTAIGTTLMDRQLPIYASMPMAPSRRGQVVITSGDVLLDFDPAEIAWADAGITGLGCHVAPDHAARHGVYCVENGGHIRRFLQKPTVHRQREVGAINAYGETVLDIGVIAFDAGTAANLLQLFEVEQQEDGIWKLGETVRQSVMAYGCDFYREICSAFGDESRLEDYIASVRNSGSRLPERFLRRIFETVSATESRVCVLNRCDFMHFGTTREILESGLQLASNRQRPKSCVSINNWIHEDTDLSKAGAWIEGCRVEAPVTHEGPGLMTGVDVRRPLVLPPHACLDILPGHDRRGKSVHFVRCYLDSDRIQNTPEEGLNLCGQPVEEWLNAAGTDSSTVWDSTVAGGERTAWNARLFPAEPSSEGYSNWLWMFSPRLATAEQYRTWATADRYSFEEMAIHADVKKFHARRMEIRAQEIWRSLRRQFRPVSGFSADDLRYVLEQEGNLVAWLKALILELRYHRESSENLDAQHAFSFSRVAHTIGSALSEMEEAGVAEGLRGSFQKLSDALQSTDREWLDSVGLAVTPQTCLTQWAERLKDLAFEDLRNRIVSTQVHRDAIRNSLRPDEIVWCRAPARLDLGGGWTDTPPYSLEHGGSVLNAAVELNGQPPIQAFARITHEPIVRIRSIDLGTHLDCGHWRQLLDFRDAASEFSLVKAALVVSGFAQRKSESLGELLQAFGGGLEITTLAAVPKGSGLGTSSIMGSVVLAAINRVLGRELTATELFHSVLKLEQELTTGGGWQDQIGGSAGGTKLITTRPGMVPEATIQYLPSDILDPEQNGGQTLLYYTGITRLAKNILQQVVGRYLDRDRRAMRVLQELQMIGPLVADALSRKDMAEFGRLIDRVWELNKSLDPESTNSQIEEVLLRVRPWIRGAKLLGAGGGGFLLLVCTSTEAAGRVRAELEESPPNDRARFFEFAVSSAGLSVSVC